MRMHQSTRGIIAIPARMASTRLPDKLMLAAAGKPILQHVIERAPMATLATAMPKGSEGMKANPNAVKVVIDKSGKAIYFSRAPVPYDRARSEEGEALWHHHLGIYAYRRDFLTEFAALPPSALEVREGLEQLRAIEHGHAIRVGIVPAAWAAKGIDTAEDFAAFARRAG